MATIQNIPGNEALSVSRPKINANFTAINDELILKATASALTAGLAGKADTAHTHSAATTSTPGFMSAADKVKLDGISGSGTPGADGDDGWSPILSVVTDGTRRVLQIVDWTGGAGTKPGVVNQFIGASGIVSTAAAAADIRGATGPAGSGAGDMLAANNLSDLANAVTARTNLGLGNVNNTSDSAKPISTATQTALDAKAPLASPAFTGTPTGITKAHVGLANADNTSDANKPVSTAQAAADAAVQAFAVQRANHTGTQLAATISDFIATARAQIEAALIAGSNVTITPAGSGATRTFTISAAGGGGDVTLTGAQTLTNKRITRRTSVSTTTATLTPNIDSFDAIKLTAQAGNLAIANPTGTPTEDQALLISVKASGGARQITFGTAYAIPSGSSFASPYTLPSGERIRFAFIYDAASAKWDIMTATPGLA